MPRPRILDLPVAASLCGLLALPAAGCGGALADLRSDERATRLNGMAGIADASDADKAEALPALLALSVGGDADLAAAAWQAVDSLHFSDARPGWRVAAADPTLCPRAVEAAEARWGAADDVVRDGLVQALAGGRCGEVDRWIWRLVEATDTQMHRETGLYGWLDSRRDAETTDRLLKLGRDPGSDVGRVGSICELLAARSKAGQLDEGTRREALDLIHDGRLPPGVRTVLGGALLKAEPPLGEDTVIAVITGSEAPSELRKDALAGLPGGRDPAALAPQVVAALGKVVTDPASPPDVRAHFGAVLARRPQGDAMAFVREVAQDAGAPRDLRAAMMDLFLAQGGEDAANVMAAVVVEGAAHPDLRAKALGGLEQVWSATAEVACVKVCEEAPLDALCAAALARLKARASGRAADAAAFGFTARVREAADPHAVRAVRSEMDGPALAALPEQVRAYTLAMAGLAAADAVAAGRFGDDEEGRKIDPALCTMKEGWEQVNALKAAGKKDEAAGVQRSMYRADLMLRAPEVDAKVKAAKRALKGPVGEGAASAALLTDPDLSARLDRVLLEKTGLKAPCVLVPEFETARRKARR